MRAAANLVLTVGLSFGLACADEPLHGDYERYVPTIHDPGPTLWDGEAAAAVAELPHRQVLGPPYPVILVHGFSGWSDLGPVGYFFQVEEDLVERGVDVTAPALPPYNVSDERARVLANVIDSVLLRTGKQKVHLVGHSQGGIDIRRTVSEHGLGYAPVVASVTTVSTPYRGTAVADLAASAPDGVLNPAGQLLAWLLGLGEGEPPSETDWADEESSDAWTPELANSTRGLTPAVMTELIDRTPWPAEVPYFTIAGVSNLASLDNDDCVGGIWQRPNRVDAIDGFLVGSGLYLSATDGPNDGLVSVKSARAPESTFLGCVPADHFDEMGQLADFGPGLISGFDHKDLYRRIVENARSVEE